MPVLSPSYRIFFENIDKTMLENVNPNTYKPKIIYLNTIAIKGVPVDEIPCIEVLDINGIVFTSHNSAISVKRECNWTSDLG